MIIIQQLSLQRGERERERERESEERRGVLERRSILYWPLVKESSVGHVVLKAIRVGGMIGGMVRVIHKMVIHGMVGDTWDSDRWDGEAELSN